MTDVVALNGAAADGVLQVAAAARALSEHPLARAITGRAALAGYDGRTTADIASERVAVTLAACSCSTPGCCAVRAAATSGREHGGHDHEAPASDGHDRDGHAHDHDGRDHAAPDRDVERFRALPGRGVRAEVDGRLTSSAGRTSSARTPRTRRSSCRRPRLEREGKTAVVVGDEDGALGVIAVSDPLRPGAAAAIADLRASASTT